MSDATGPKPSGTKATLGLTGLTSNAMALIAPGAFLWLTFVMQLSYGKPLAGESMWFGILLALCLCFVLLRRAGVPFQKNRLSLGSPL